jgi:hypothetical protein
LNAITLEKQKISLGQAGKPPNRGKKKNQSNGKQE